MTAPPDIAARLVDRLERISGAAGERAAKAVHERLAKAGVDVAHLAADMRAVAMAEARDSLAAKLERRRAQAALREELRKLGRGGAPAPGPAAPTRELVRQMGGPPAAETVDHKGDPLSGTRYRWRWSIDRMGVHLTAGEYAAAERLRRAWALRRNTPGVIDWRRSGASAPGARLPIRDEQLAAAREVEHVTRGLPWAVRGIIANFVLEEAPRGRAAPLDATEFGRLYGSVQDAATARGVTYGAIRAALALVEELLDGYDRARRADREATKQKRYAEEGR